MGLTPLDWMSYVWISNNGDHHMSIYIPTYDTLRRDADKMKRTRLYDRVDHILDSARINADDTVYLEKSAYDWNGIAVSTIECLLSDQDQVTVSWFARRGVRV